MTWGTITGTIALGGYPESPVMIAEGVCIYRPGGSVVRKVNLSGGTDVALGTLNHQSGNPCYIPQYLNDDYIIDEKFTSVTPGAARYLMGIDGTVGTYNVQQIPPGTNVLTSYGIVAETPSGGAGVSMNQTTGYWAWQWPNPATGTLAGTSVQQSSWLFTKVPVPTGTTYGTQNCFVYGTQILGMQFGGTANSNFVFLNFDGTGPQGATLYKCGQQGGFPWMAQFDGTNKLYYFTYESGGTASDTMYICEHEILNGTGGTSDAKTYHSLGASQGTLQQWVYDTFSYYQGTAVDRFYYSFGNNAHKLFRDAGTDITGGTGFDVYGSATPSMAITGVFTDYYPNIYVTVGSCGTLGNVMFKIEDSEGAGGVFCPYYYTDLLAGWE